MYYMSKERKDAFVIIRVSQFEKNDLVHAAELKGVTLSEYMREIIAPYIQDD